MSPLTMKKKLTFMSLPYDLIFNCLARISRLYYPILSLVSKSFRSLLALPELYEVRSLMGYTESCLYVCFRSSTQSIWFTLCLKPGKKKGYALARVPILDSPETYFSGLVVVGSSIYNIARSKYLFYEPNSLSILDCRSHTWLEAPSMRMELMSFSASVLDQKIYVSGWGIGGDGSVKNSIEVFDTKTQVWDPNPIPCSKIYDGSYDKTLCIDGKFHVVNLLKEDDVAYHSKEGRWDVVKRGMDDLMRSDAYCVIENVLFSAHDGAIRWYDTEISKWRELKCLVELPKFPNDACVRLADYGGKMAVLWDKRLSYYYGFSSNIIWCAEIALKRHKNREIWGKLEWCDHLQVPSFDFVKVLAVTV